jgi:hypothetical protein
LPLLFYSYSLSGALKATLTLLAWYLYCVNMEPEVLHSLIGGQGIYDRETLISVINGLKHLIWRVVNGCLLEQRQICIRLYEDIGLNGGVIWFCIF